MIARIYLWDVYVGALNWNVEAQRGEFEFTPEFVKTGLEISPIHMPLREDYTYVFQGLDRETFKGLPSILADSLPDDFGNALIDAWLAQQGRDKATFSPVERLLYQGTRGMGALEYKPAMAVDQDKAESIQIDSLVRLASEVLSDRQSLAERLTVHDPSVDDAALQHLIQIGTSAGGARAKAVIALNGKGEIRSGQITAPPGFEYWLLKFDVAKDSKVLADSQGYGRIEYAYHLMAKAAGVTMTECRLLEEGSRAHFMTKRFDRTADGEKIHVSTLCALDHADFRKPGMYSYEQGFGVLRSLGLGRNDAEQFYRRMVFNVVARNQDDHTKNTAFMMDTDGSWYLTPAYDVSYSYLPGSFWVDTHQMTINGKRDDFTLDDLLGVAKLVRGMDAKQIIKDVCDAVERWPSFAAQAGVSEQALVKIGQVHRLYLGETL